MLESSGLEKRNYSINEFVKIYGVSRTTVYKELSLGRLKLFKVGKRTLISRGAAEAWQAQLEGASAGEVA